jgi:hypothetical protein
VGVLCWSMDVLRFQERGGAPLNQPNKARAANPAMTFPFHAGRQWRGVADERRSAATNLLAHETRLHID